MTLTKETAYKLSSGHQIPAIGLGVYLTPDDVTENVVYEALKLGYRHIDSAKAYKNERTTALGIQKWIAEDPKSNRREDVFYTTKIFTDDQGYELTLKAFAESFELVKHLEYVDLVLVHSPRTNKQKRLDTYKALQDLVELGKVKSIGVSNYGIKHLEELFLWDGYRIKPVLNQIELSPWLLRQELTDFHDKHGIISEAYAPLTRGKRLDHPDLLTVAANLKKTPAQVLLRWSLQRGYVTLPKTTHLQRLKENLDIYDFEIDEENDKILTKDENWISNPGRGDPLYYEDE